MELTYSLAFEAVIALGLLEDSERHHLGSGEAIAFAAEFQYQLVLPDLSNCRCHFIQRLWHRETVLSNPFLLWRPAAAEVVKLRLVD